jgi:methylmalonyl-CoA/ethylmalonyl-CoA epimerase
MIDFKFKHIGVAVKDIQRSVEKYGDIFGYKVISGPFNDPIQKAVVCFIGSSVENEPMIELISPLTEDSFVHRMLKKEMGVYHSCYEVQDIDQTLEAVRKKGCIIISNPVPAVAFQGKRIAWFFMPTSQLIEVVEK